MNGSPASAGVEHILLTVIAQLVVIIAAARVSAAIFRRLGQPGVCGEIAAGLILGPSLFGKLFPGLSRQIFNPDAGQVFSIISQLGLVLLMFLVGMEFDFTYLPANRRTALSISLAGVAFPFALGLALGRYMHPALGLAGSPLNFSLFMAAAMSITAIPVLGRILIELNLTRTRIGALTISAAAVDDASGWIILALVTAVVRSTFDPGRLFWMVGGVAAYAFFMMFVVRPLVARWAASQIEAHGPRLTLNAFAAILVMVFVSAAITNLIGIFSIFGGFAMGAILFDQKALKDAVSARLFDFVTVFFLPVFFTYTGLRTDIGTMVGWTLWGLCGLVLLAAIVGKFGGCTLAARWNGVSWRESCTIGIMMNTRGLMELIVINMGYDLGIIPRTVFFMLVVMAVVTTAVTTPALSVLIRKTEAEDAYRQSHFATSQRSFAA